MDKEQEARNRRKQHRSNRWDCLLHYSPRARPSKEDPCCVGLFPQVCSRDKDTRCLLIDHVADNGAEHRRQIGRSSSKLYAFLVRNNFPSGYQVLCHNCSAIKEFVRRRKALVKGFDNDEE